MAEALPEIRVPALATTERLVTLPPLFLRDAVTGSPPRLRTALRLGRRAGALCVRFDGRDDGLVATRTARDEPLWTEDVFEVFLAPGGETPRVYFEIEVNPLGALYDARVSSPQGGRATMTVEAAWDCPGLEARVSRDARRWSATLRIPLEPLSGGEPPPVWRANFFRIDRGALDAYSAWAPTFADPPDFHVPARFGVLRLLPAPGPQGLVGPR